MFLGLTSRFDLLKSSGTEERVTSILFVFEYNDKPLASYVTFYYHKTHRVAIFDIPGNVGRIIKKINRVDRIDTVYNSKKFSNYTDEIEALIGIDIQHTMVFELSNLGKTVDMLEGVKILIPSAIAFYNGENSILFPSGWITLDGDKSQRYLIYENEGNENESIEQRHQRFFIGFLKRLGESNSYIKLPQIDKRLSTLARTNMNHKTRIKIYDELAGIDTDRATVQRVIGNYRDVSGQMLLIPHYDGEMIKDAVRQTLIALTRQLDRSVSGKIITVEVLNGTNISGLAGRTAELIRGFGYDVVNVGNTDRNDYEHTQIIDHFNHPEESEIFAEIINCDVIIHEKPEDDFELQTIEYKADFTLILGMDYRGRFK
jgi:anionic cell wall polymer biosynthesis LytR-Cps2A-Psr (LCP) family protein